VPVPAKAKCRVNMTVSRAAGPTAVTNATKSEKKRERAQRMLRLVLFLALSVVLIASGVGAAAAQQASPTPEVATPAAAGSPTGTQTQIAEIATQSPINIIYPVHGLKVTGVVDVTGTIGVAGWTRYELAFDFATDQSGSWFVFGSGSSPLSGTALGSWKTTAISDGDYNLRLRVYLPGSFQDIFVYGLRVRNYTPDTPVPTLTYTPTATSAATATPVPTLAPTFTVTPTLTAFPSPTALAANPAILSGNEIAFDLGRGALLIVVLFGAFGVLLRLRRR